MTLDMNRTRRHSRVDADIGAPPKAAAATLGFAVPIKSRPRWKKP